MLKFYQAILEILSLHKAGSLQIPETLLSAFRLFEQRNRGHRHLLNDCLEPSLEKDPSRRHELHAARDHFSLHLLNIQQALQNLTQAEFPDHPKFQALLDYPDPSGVMRAQARRACTNYADFGHWRQQSASPHIYVENLTSAQIDSTWQLSLTFKHRTNLDARAERKFIMPCPDHLNSLRSCWLFCRDFKRSFKSQHPFPEKWPEFEASRLQALAADRLLRKFDKAMSTFSPEEKQQLSAQWAGLRPAA